LSHPVGLVFSPAGDLYFGDSGYSNVRKIAATAGFITTTGVISLIDGSPAGTFGYTSNFGSTTINAATQGFLDGPYGLSFDAAGNLYIADEFKNAVVVVNTNAATTTKVTGISIPPGTVAKIVGSVTAGGSVCPNSPASTNGCNYGLATFNGPANTSETDSPYGVGADSLGNVYFAGEFDNYIAKISASGVLTDFAGIQGTAAKKLIRGTAGSFAIGSPFGVVADSSNNVYFTDASSGVVWRVDAVGLSQYVVAGGAATVCAAATDTWGDGCPATQAKFGSSGSGNFATASSPGIFGVSVDAFSDLFVGDSLTGLVREVASGTQFGTVGANQPTQLVDIHFAPSDLPAPSAYTLTAGASNFALGAATCTTNSDSTTDCLLPLTATPSVLGPFTGTLQVNSSLGGVASFALSGIYVMSPLTRTTLAATNTAGTCTGTTIYATTAAIALTATVSSSGTPTGTVTFFANGTQIGTPQTVSNGTATLTFTFTTPNTYLITAKYSGDSYFKTSTTATPTTVTTSSPTFTASALTPQENTVTAGQSALYSFNVAQNVYSGTITMSCSGLPANSSCSFNPAAIAATGCSTASTVALSILTQAGSASGLASLGGGGRGIWQLFSLITGFALALAIGLRRRQTPLRFRTLGMAVVLLLASCTMAACGSGNAAVPATPSGAYTVTVTATGSTGIISTFAVPLTIK